MIDHITQRLLETQFARTNSNGKELVIVRCPFCGDSTHSNTPHMHIGVRDNNTLVMDCKKCFVQGTVTTEVFHKLGIYDPTIDEYIKTVNKTTYSKIYHTPFGDNNNKIQLIYTKTSKYPKKIEYMNNRTHLDFNKFKIQQQYKIVLDIKEFYLQNNLPIPIRSDRFDILADNSIGFVSYDNKSISLRDITKSSGGNRFHIFHFDQRKRSPYLYIPPCNIDLLAEEPIIVMAEGAFDIICIKNYFYSEHDTNIIFGATSSKKAYTRTLNKLLYLTGFFGGTIMIYADNDQNFDIDEYKKIFSLYLPSFVVKLIINQNGKDFGQMPDSGEFDFKLYKF